MTDVLKYSQNILEMRSIVISNKNEIVDPLTCYLVFNPLHNLRESFGLPNPNMEPFKAIKAASPPLDPPGVREGSLGWQVVP